MAPDYGIRVCVDACQTTGTHEFDPYTVDWAVFSIMYGPQVKEFPIVDIPMKDIELLGKEGDPTL